MSRRRAVALLAGVAVLGATFLAGVAVGRWRLPPFAALHAAWRTVRGRRGEPVPEHPATIAARVARDRRVRETPTASLLSAGLEGAPESLRAALAESIFGHGGSPETRPAVLRAPVDVPEPWSVATDLDGHWVRREVLDVPVDHGIDAVVELLRPAVVDGWVLVLPGHEPAAEMVPLLRDLLDHGRAIAVVAMPLVSPNPRPEVRLPGGGLLALATHTDLSALRYPLRCFLLPPLAVIDHLRRTESIETVDAAGHSGGAWTVTVLAALEPRVRVSAQISGTLPLHMRLPDFHGHVENVHADLLDVVSYPDLYVLAAHGRGRHHWLIHNAGDPSAPSAPQVESLGRELGAVLDRMGEGEFHVHVDEQAPGHELSTGVVAKVVEAITAAPDAR